MHSRVITGLKVKECATNCTMPGVRTRPIEVMFYDVNNQQDATTFSFINLFKSAQHVSGDKFAHPQELFLTVYTADRTVPSQLWHRSAAEAVNCTKSCIYSQKVNFNVFFKLIKVLLLVSEFYMKG